MFDEISDPETIVAIVSAIVGKIYLIVLGLTELKKRRKEVSSDSIVKGILDAFSKISSQDKENKKRPKKKTK